MNNIKKHWLKYILGIGVASASLLYGLNPKTGQVYDPNNFDVAPLIFNNEPAINFPCADQDNTGRNIIVKMDNCNVQVFDYQYTYAAITNISGKNFPITKIQFSDNNGANTAEVEQLFPKVSYQVDVNDYGTSTIDCLSEPIATSTPFNENGFVCNQQIIYCTSIDGNNCLQANSVTGTHQETIYKDEWHPLIKNQQLDPTLDDLTQSPVPTQYKLKDQISSSLLKDQTVYFRIKLHTPLGIHGKFYITAFGFDSNGTQTGFGQLDPAWYSNSWAYRVPIVIDHTKVASTTGDVYTSFPVLASTTATSLKTVANGGHVGTTNGQDILFTLSDGTTKLNHELEYYASTTGQLLAWVNMGTGNLSTSTDTTIYAYYGNAAASDQQNVTGTWDTNYKGVWHLPNGTTLGLNDSTSNSNTGSLTGTVPATTGQIDGASSWSNNVSNFISIPNSASTDLTTSALTVSAWINLTNTGTYQVIFGKMDGTGGNQRKWNLYVNGSGLFGWEIGNSSNQFNIEQGAVSYGNWHYMVGYYDGTNMIAYLDGVNVSSISHSGALPSRTSAALIGKFINGIFPLNGKVDEIRLSNIARSADWIKTEYNNQSNPGTFETWGTEEANASARAVINGAIINGAVIN